MEKFIKEELKEFTISQETIRYLLTKVGSDLYRIRFECDKLKTRAKVKGQSVIDEVMIDYIVFGQVETDSFALLKALFTDSRQAIQLLEKIQSSGVDRNQFAGMLYRALKFYLFMIDLNESGITDTKLMASKLKMNPWQVKNEYAKMSLFTTHKHHIEYFYTQLVALDADIKT